MRPRAAAGGERAWWGRAPRPRCPARALLGLLATLVALLLVSYGRPAHGYAPPPLAGAVNDTAGLLSTAERAELEATLAAHRKAHGHEVVIFTVASLAGASIEDVAYATFNAWGVGKRGKDDGVLLVVAPNERRTRIESGKGVGGQLTDLVTKRILAERVGPKLKLGRGYEALRDGVESIHSVLLGGPIEPAREAGAPGDAAPAAQRSRRIEPPTYAPTSLFVDGTDAFPADLRARYLAATEAQRKQRAPLLAVIVVPDPISPDAPLVAGANLHAFQTAFPDCKAILVVGGNGRNLYVFFNLASLSDGTAVGLQSAASLAKAKVGSAAVERRPALLVDEAIALQQGLARVPGDAWRSPPQEVTWLGVLPWILGIFAVIGFITWLFGKLGWTSGPGGGGASGGYRSGAGASAAGSRGGSGGGSGGGGYTGGGGSSGGGGASDSY